MNNTRTLAIAAVLMAATLVVGGTLGATTSVFAYQKKGESGSKNGNTVTIQKCKQDATQSGFDNNQGQECENLICTHPGENATCTQEGVRSAAAEAAEPTTTTLLVKKVVKCIDTIIVDGCQNKKFNIKVTDTNPDPSSFDLGNGGTQLVTLGAGTYTVSEPEHNGFNVEFSGDCNANGDGTIAAGAHQTCTITNTEHTCVRLC
jgi:hypothetical protein